jgi:hypothetical protein
MAAVWNLYRKILAVLMEHKMKIHPALILAPAFLASPALTHAAVVFESEANDWLAAAQPVDGFFSLDPSLYIGDGATSPSGDTSTTIPHVSIIGSGNGSLDYYSFIYPGPGATAGTIHIDIDFVTPGFDAWVALWDSAGNLLGHNDDYDYRGGRGGSISNYAVDMSYDSFMTTFLTTADTYIVGVAKSPASPGFAGFNISGSDIPSSVFTYTLQVSVENIPLPEPSSLSLLAMSALALLRRR